MALIPRSLVTLGASLHSARAAGRLKRAVREADAQDKILKGLTSRLAATSVWNALGVEAGMSYATFRQRLPLQGYDDLAPHIERMKKGEENVLWPGHCQIYAESPGTTNGRKKTLPVTEPMLDHFWRAGNDALAAYTLRAGNARVFRSRHLFLSGSTELTPIPESEPFEAFTGDLSGIAALNLPRWMEKHLYEPGAEIAQMSDWPSRVAAIVKRTATVDISLVAGIPNWVLILAEALRAHAGGVENLKSIWPNLECLVHGGVPIGPFHDEIRACLGPEVRFHEVYPAAEAFVAVQDGDPASGLRLLADAGIFYEFVPMAEFDEQKLSTLAGKAVPVEGVKTGTDYAVILTTPGGLARYVLGDVVRFVSTKPVRLLVVGRTRLQLNAFAERVSERDITEALLVVCRRNGWTTASFHVAPIFSNSTTGRLHGRHEWWVELKPGTFLTPTGPVMAGELDVELRRINPDYEARRANGTLDSPFVRLVMPGVFEQWMRHHGRWGGQNKMPRCSDERLIADELGSVLQFAKD